MMNEIVRAGSSVPVCSPPRTAEREKRRAKKKKNAPARSEERTPFAASENRESLRCPEEVRGSEVLRSLRLYHLEIKRGFRTAKRRYG